jgi:hypothetical protein
MSARIVFASLILGTVTALLPIAVFAQTAQDDLHAAILTSLLADPRSAGIPPAQMKSLVDALALQAQAQHMTAADILWRPNVVPSFSNSQGSADTTACGGGFSGYLCAINQSFGFGGDDVLVPAFLFASSGLLVVVIRRMRINHRAQLAASAAAAAADAPPWSQPQP